MNILLFEIADIALDLAESHMKKDGHPTETIAEKLVQIIQKSIRAYRDHTGKPVDRALLTT